METLRHKGTCEGACPHARPGLVEQTVLLQGSGERRPHPGTAERCPGAWREASQVLRNPLPVSSRPETSRDPALSRPWGGQGPAPCPTRAPWRPAGEKGPQAAG